MKQTFAVVVLLAALGVLCKLALKPRSPLAEPVPGASVARELPAQPGSHTADPQSELMRRYANVPNRSESWSLGLPIDFARMRWRSTGPTD